MTDPRDKTKGQIQPIPGEETGDTTEEKIPTDRAEQLPNWIGDD